MNSNFRSKASVTGAFRTKLGVSVAALAGIAATALLVVPRAHADSWDKMTRLTFTEPTQVQNTYLEPGTYMFKLADGDRHIVQIFNSDRSHLINTIIAIPAYHTNRVGRTVVTFWETPPGMAKAMRDWYWPGDYDGQEFRYPTNLRQVAAVTQTSFATPAPAPPPAFTEPAPAPPAAEPEAQEVAPPQEQQAPVEIAQNEVPPPPPAPEPAPQAAAADNQSQSSSQSESLPHTATYYPLAGLGGALCLALYLGLRVKRTGL